MYFFLIADKLLAIVFRIIVSNYIFVECDIKSFTVWKSCHICLFLFFTLPKPTHQLLNVCIHIISPQQFMKH